MRRQMMMSAPRRHDRTFQINGFIAKAFERAEDFLNPTTFTARLLDADCVPDYGVELHDRFGESGNMTRPF